MVMIDFTALATDTITDESFEIEGTSSGSAFCIRSHKHGDRYVSYYVTNQHVVDDYESFNEKEMKRNLIHTELSSSSERYEIEYISMSEPYLFTGIDYIKGDEDATHSAVLLGTESIMDVAVLVVELPYYVQPLEFADSVSVGEEIFCFSAAEGIPFYLTKGILGQKNLDLGAGWINLLRYNTDISFGSSGAALLNKDTKIVGMVKGTFVDEFFGTIIPGQYLGVDGGDLYAWLIVNGYLGDDR
jgi:S1-C subfamily serine protease